MQTISQANTAIPAWYSYLTMTITPVFTDDVHGSAAVLDLRCDGRLLGAADAAHSGDAAHPAARHYRAGTDFIIYALFPVLKIRLVF